MMSDGKWADEDGIFVLCWSSLMDQPVGHPHDFETHVSRQFFVSGFGPQLFQFKQLEDHSFFSSNIFFQFIQQNPKITAESRTWMMDDELGDPQVVANGVNFFWRKAHLPGLPAIAHANGVGPKSYFLRLGRGGWFASLGAKLLLRQDRGVWYVDDLLAAGLQPEDGRNTN